MKKTDLQLVFVPMPGRGHLVAHIEFANQLLNKDDRFSVTVLVMNSPFELTTSISTVISESGQSSHPRLRYIDVPTPEHVPSRDLVLDCGNKYITEYSKSHKSQVKEIITNLISSKTRLCGLVVDLFSTSMIEVAEEVGVPSYVFFTSGVGFLGFMYYMADRGDDAFERSDPDSDVPSYANPVPTRVLPTFAFNNRGGYATFAYHARNFKKPKGIIVNSILELESHAVGSLSGGETPPIYTVGPLLDLNYGRHYLEADRSQDYEKIMTWLDRQPAKSVVLLCFGSRGFFTVQQLREIAIGVEQSGQRFLWFVRKPPSQKMLLPQEYADPEEFLPPGFLERTKEVGLVICGWAPQVDVLAHEAVGGFVSHCGWNSLLESLWFGVPVVTWPLYAEQQINAFQLVRDLGLAEELSLEFRRDGGDIVMADEIARAIRSVMDGDCVVRRKVEEMSEKCRNAVVDGGSSFVSFGKFIEDLLANVL